MQVEAYDLDSLRKLVRGLQDENRRLKVQLEQAGMAYEAENIFDEKSENIKEYDPDQGGRILDRYITKDLANQYFSFFWGRTDVSVSGCGQQYRKPDRTAIAGYGSKKW